MGHFLVNCAFRLIFFRKILLCCVVQSGGDKKLSLFEDFHSILVKCHVSLSWTQNKSESWRTWQRSSTEFLFPGCQQENKSPQCFGDRKTMWWSIEWTAFYRDHFQGRISKIAIITELSRLRSYTARAPLPDFFVAPFRTFGRRILTVISCAIYDLTRACHWARTRIGFIHSVPKDRP